MPTSNSNSPAVIAQARKRIADMGQHLSKHPGNTMLCHGDVMEVSGYLTALLDSGLIDPVMFVQLCDERDAVEASARPAKN